MADNAQIAAYERMIAAMNQFQKKNTEISEEITMCAANAMEAMYGDEISIELADCIIRINKQITQVNQKAEALKRSLTDTLNELLSLRRRDS